MNVALTKTQQLAVLGWLATATITFCLGRLTSTSSSTVRDNAEHAAEFSLAVSPTPALPTPTSGVVAERAGRVDGISATTESVTGGKPMAEWLKHLMAQEDEIIRMTGFLKLIETLDTPEKIKEALEVTAPKSNRDWARGSREAAMLLQKWTQLDAKGAIAYTQGLSREQRWMGTAAVLRTWTRLNPSEAIAWAQQNGQASSPQENDAQQSGELRGGANFAIGMVVSQLASTDLERALQLASAQDLGQRGRALDTLASELVSQRGAESARAAVASLPDGAFRDGMTAQIASRLTGKEAQSTADWVLSLPGGEGRGRALAAVVGAWAQDDPVAVGNYLSRLPVSAETDASRERYASNVINKDPESAMAWAGTISDQQQRTQTLENLARTWLKRDSNAAQNWIAQSQLSEPLKSRLLPRK